MLSLSKKKKTKTNQCDELDEKIDPNNEIRDELEKSNWDYAMSVIVSRELPDISYGWKPVHRRIVYAM